MGNEKRVRHTNSVLLKLFGGAAIVLCVGLFLALLTGTAAAARPAEYREIIVYTFVDGNENGVWDGFSEDQRFDVVWVEVQKPGKDMMGGSTDDGELVAEVYESGMYRINLSQYPDGYQLRSIRCENSFREQFSPCKVDVENAEAKVVVRKGENPYIYFGFVPQD